MMYVIVELQLGDIIKSWTLIKAFQIDIFKIKLISVHFICCPQASIHLYQAAINVYKTTRVRASHNLRQKMRQFWLISLSLC